PCIQATHGNEGLEAQPWEARRGIEINQVASDTSSPIGRQCGRSSCPQTSEPLLEQPSRHFLQQRDPMPVHFNQIVVGAKNGGDAVLCLKRWYGHLDLRELLA